MMYIKIQLATQCVKTYSFLFHKQLILRAKLQKSCINVKKVFVLLQKKSKFARLYSI